MKIKNVAIIAHVDHGKTTLVDSLFKQTLQERETQKLSERAMDSHDLEKERGITIMSKCTSVFYKDYKINIVDTPGHSDFGGEVERILGMVDGVILLVDSQEGTMPQTHFVTSKALELGLAPVVIMNKMDKPDKRPQQVHDEILELFMNLNATNEQLDFPLLYASGRDGWVSLKEDQKGSNMDLLFDIIISKIPDPKVSGDQFQFLATMLEYDSFVGRILIGRIYSGSVKVGISLKALNRDHQLIEQSKVSKIMTFEGLTRKTVEEAKEGDIVALAGFTQATVSDTLCSMETDKAIPSKPIDPSLLSIYVSVNNSPFAGQDGNKLTSRVLRDRLFLEQEGNVSIKVEETSVSDSFEVFGRGELQLAILIETMRREGFELLVSRPKVLLKKEGSKVFEPIEKVQIDVDEAFSGTVMESLQKRRGLLQQMDTSQGGKVRLHFFVPTRGLIGYYGTFLTETRGTGTMSRLFHEYTEWTGTIESRGKGGLISTATGKAVAYALFFIQERGILFIEPGDQVYVGMMIGECARENDLEVNPTKAKQLTNVRAAGKDSNLLLNSPRKLTLEEAISYIEEDEMIEVTPSYLRLRKKYLDPNERKRLSRKKTN